MSLYRASATVGAMTGVSRILGFVRDVLVAAVLGAGPVADAFFVAFRIPNLFRRIFAEGAFSAAFIPLFAKRQHGEGGEAAGRIFAEQALAGLTLALIILTILGEIFMYWIIVALAPGFVADPAKLELAVLLARIALPYLLCMSLVALYAGILNSLGKFAAAAFAPSLLNVVLILVLVGVIVFGKGEEKYQAGIWLAWGVALSGILQVLVVGIAAARAGMRLSPRRPCFNDDMKRLLALGTPAVIAGGVTQITVILTTIIASLQDRVVSWLYYADRLFQLPLGMIGIAISVALLPDLSRKIRADNRAAALESENRALEAALLLTRPASVALFVAAQPIVSVLFERGAFTATDAAATAGMLAALALGLPAFVLVRVLQPGFFAREDTKAPMLYSGIGMGANAVFSLALFLVLGPVGIALGTAFAGWLQVTLLARTLRRRGDFILDQNFRRRAPAICIASVIMGAVLWLLSGVFEAWMAPTNPTLFRVTGLTALVGGGLLVYAAAAEWLGATSFRPFLRSLAKRKPA